MVYFFLNGSLVRTDPETMKVETLCRAEPGRMAFIEDDLYIAGTTQLRRVVEISGQR